MAAAALANCSDSFRDFPSTIATARLPQKVSPAAVVSTASTLYDSTFTFSSFVTTKAP
jgi:hypothetical protein